MMPSGNAVPRPLQSGLQHGLQVRLYIRHLASSAWVAGAATICISAIPKTAPRRLIAALQSFVVQLTVGGLREESTLSNHWSKPR